MGRREVETDAAAAAAIDHEAADLHWRSRVVTRPEQEELALTVRASADMREQGSIVTVVEQVWQSRPGLLVPHGDSSPSSVASRLRPRRFQLLTEPSGTCRRFAIALSLRSR